MVTRSRVSAISLRISMQYICTRAVFARCRQAFPVRDPGYTLNFFATTAECEQLFTGRSVPHLRRLVRSPRRQA